MLKKQLAVLFGAIALILFALLLSYFYGSDRSIAPTTPSTPESTPETDEERLLRLDEKDSEYRALVEKLAQGDIGSERITLQIKESCRPDPFVLKLTPTQGLMISNRMNKEVTIARLQTVESRVPTGQQIFIAAGFNNGKDIIKYICLGPTGNNPGFILVMK